MFCFVGMIIFFFYFPIRLLSMLVTLTNAKRVLELGTFTGYSALCFAEGMMANAATNDGGGGGGRVVTCEIDDKAAEIAQKFFTESAYADMVMVFQFCFVNIIFIAHNYRRHYAYQLLSELLKWSLINFIFNELCD